MMYVKVTVENLYLYAINTGEWYALHCQLAREDAPRSAWLLHVKQRVWHAYHKQFPNELATPATLDSVADELREYYVAHIAETEGVQK